LKRAGAVDILFRRFDEALRASGFLAMSGQIVDATIVSAPKQRNTQEEKQAIREGRIPEDWMNKPAKLVQKHRDARWTIKYTKAKLEEDAAPHVDLAIPAFGYKNHIAIDRAHGLIRKWTATHAAAHDGARLEEVLDRANTASEVWADTAYRSAKNEVMLARWGFVSRIHRRKPKGKPMPERTRISNARKSRVRSAVEHAGPDDPHDRLGESPRQDWPCRPSLQHPALHLAYDTLRSRLTEQASQHCYTNDPSQHLLRCGTRAYLASPQKNPSCWRCPADVALPIAQHFANSNGAFHEFVDKLRIFALHRIPHRHWGR
jgi:hypothetical protein